MIRATENDYRRPRWGIDPWAWHGIVKLAIDYQQSDGNYDWPGQRPDPRETNPRLVYARWLAPLLITEEFTA